MKITEVIKELESLKDEFGDVEVYVPVNYIDGSYKKVECIYYEEGDDVDYGYDNRISMD